MAGLGYPPHVTLAIYDAVDPDMLGEVLRDVFSGQPEVRIRFNELRCFDVSPMVLWAAPADTSELMRLHALIHDRIDPADCREHYRPNAWVPHCTLATHVSGTRTADARSAAGPIDPFEVTFDAADVVDFPPVKVVHELDLK